MLYYNIKFHFWSTGVNTYMIQLYLHGGHTLGDTLMAMCMFNSLNQPVHIVTSMNSWYITWKQIFDIKEQVTLDPVEACPTWINPPHERHLESFKIFSRYDQFDHITLDGKNFPIYSRRKKKAAILINDGSYADTDLFFSSVNNSNEYPFVKYHKKETYDAIFSLVQSAGYEPVVIDSKQMPIEQKIFVLNEDCDFVIGYEGGLCHLAHALKIPAVILPWRVVAGEYTTDFLHIDKRTYFIRHVEELLSFDPNNFKSLIDQLHEESGYNNIWMTDEVFPDPSRFLEHYCRDSGSSFTNQFRWAQPYTTKFALGGY
jgi:hypothetical protein